MAASFTGQTGPENLAGCAFGRQAARLDHSVLYLRVPRLFEDLATGRVDGRFQRLIDKLARLQLLIDDSGTHTLNDQRLDLLEIFEERYRRKSTLITPSCPLRLPPACRTWWRAGAAVHPQRHEDQALSVIGRDPNYIPSSGSTCTGGIRRPGRASAASGGDIG
jgi:hypothetical protein